MSEVAFTVAKRTDLSQNPGELVIPSTEVTSLEMQLRDLREMPSKNPPRNGMHSVSRGYVFLKEWFPGCVTPRVRTNLV